MSQLLIQQYLNQLSTLKKVSGTQRESVVREAFKDLLKGWAKSHDLVFIPEYEFESKTKERRYVDGALLYELRMPFGYWEAKDEKDDLEAEIEYKFKRGYPQDNIIFEDSKLAILIQNRQEVVRCFVDDTKGLEKLLDLFFGYERKEISEFRKAVDQFKTDLPAVLEGLRKMIEAAHKENAGFRKAAAVFLTHAQETINPTLGEADVREMLIQHILTEEIFAAVFPEAPFHKDNNVARELYKLEATFFTGNTKFKTLKGLEPYYHAIRGAASQIGGHHEKQTFLKVIYENFYKVYNKKAADRLGVVYTPNEIVRFMIESADWLCEKHFGRNLIDKDVEILDPATGTGTFICELLEHFRGQPAKLKQKYKRELHANEVAILPYYVANLNIEATYAAITGEYEEYPNLCFVDTLDNVAGLRKHAGHIDDMFGAVSDINIKRIREQNNRRISVIIGNPPYNANQLNENDNNKNREYPEIDKRIKETYIAASKAQKTKMYDMYARFFRWASDRIDENGVLAFITNRSFIDSRTFDGFRATVPKEFSDILIVDLGGDIRGGAPDSKSNVFGIRVGVAISFFVKKRGIRTCRIRYSDALLRGSVESKLVGLQQLGPDDHSFRDLVPTNKKLDWLMDGIESTDGLLPIGDKVLKAKSGIARGSALFKFYTLGVVTARDEWVYDHDPKLVAGKVNHLISVYDTDRKRFGGGTRQLSKATVASLDYGIKWTRAVKRDLARGVKYEFDQERIIQVTYRPFTRRWLYFDGHLNEMRYQLPSVYGEKGSQKIRTIVVTDPGSQKPFMVFAVEGVFDYHLVGAAAAAVSFPYSEIDSGATPKNITDWALERFRKNYAANEDSAKQRITKEAIFHYIYGVLNDLGFREKYAVNLKHELPRIPFYKDFWRWSQWGESLMDLHIGYESVAPVKLKRIDVQDEQVRKAGQTPKTILRADKEGGRIVVDSETTLAGIPPEAWEYRLGNRSALEWVLDQYKESKPKDPTIRAKFDTYRFADYKEKVIDLLARVTTVSVETQKIVEAMRRAR